MDELKTIFYDRGMATGLGVKEIIANQESLKDAIETHDPEIEYLTEMVGFGSFSAAFDTVGLHTLFERRTHPDIKITHAFVTLGDNAPEEVTVRLLKSGKKDITGALTMKATEKRGKVQIFDLNSLAIIPQFDSLIVQLSTSRRVVVTVSFINLKVA